MIDESSGSVVALRAFVGLMQTTEKKVYQEYFASRIYSKLVNILSNNKILFGNVAENWRSKPLFYFRSKLFNLTPLC